VIKLSQYGKFVQRRDPRSTLPELMRAVLIGERGVRDEGIKEKWKRAVERRKTEKRVKREVEMRRKREAKRKKQNQSVAKKWKRGNVKKVCHNFCKKNCTYLLHVRYD
jgi:hypothetical protein